MKLNMTKCTFEQSYVTSRKLLKKQKNHVIYVLDISVFVMFKKKYGRNSNDIQLFIFITSFYTLKSLMSLPQPKIRFIIN